MILTLLVCLSSHFPCFLTHIGCRWFQVTFLGKFDVYSKGKRGFFVIYLLRNMIQCYISCVSKVCESRELAVNLKAKLESISSEVFSVSGRTIRCHCLPCFIVFVEGLVYTAGFDVHYTFFHLWPISNSCVYTCHTSSMFPALLSFGEVPIVAVLMMYRMQCLRKSDLPVYMTVALAHIWFISDLLPHMNEAWNRSRNIQMHVFFLLSCSLHGHRTHPISVTYEKKI